MNKCIAVFGAGLSGQSVANLAKSEGHSVTVFDETVGKKNDFWVHEIAKEAVIKVAAWGNHGKFLNRSEKILTSLDQLPCIKMNKSGEPAHPLYLKAELSPFPINNCY